MVLVEEEIKSDEGWRNYLDELYEISKRVENKTIIYPVAFNNTSLNIRSKIGKLNFLKIYEPQSGSDTLDEASFEL